MSVVEADTVTSIHHEWQFTTRRWWMNIAAPVARWFFLRRYKAILRQGAEGLAHHLDARLLNERTDELPPLRSGRAPPFDIAAAVGAGCAAGVSSTFLQMGIWLGLSYPVWDMLLRDSRFAAAIVLGPRVLPPPATFDLFIMLVAGILHFVLSATYGLAIAALVNRMKMTAAVGLGTISGLLLFILNMGGFTGVFPWFVASRDTAAAVAHLGFGVTAAACYRYAQPLGIRAHSH